MIITKKKKKKSEDIAPVFSEETKQAIKTTAKSTVDKAIEGTSLGRIKDTWSNGYQVGDITNTILNAKSIFDPATMVSDQITKTAKSAVNMVKSADGNFLKSSKAKENLSNIWDDGYQFGDIAKSRNEITKTILGTTGDVAANLAKGELQTAEGLVDTGRYVVSDVAKLLGADKYSANVKERAKQNTTGFIFGENDEFNNPKENGWAKKLDEYSVFDNKMDQIVQSVGQQGFRVGLQGAIGMTGASEGTVEALNKLEIFAGSYGTAKSEALANGASDRDATIRGVISGTAEYISENLFDSLPGFKTGEAAGVSKLKSIIGESAEKTFGKGAGKVILRVFGAAGEGFEEILSNGLETAGTDIVNLIASDYNYGMQEGQGLNEDTFIKNAAKLFKDVYGSAFSKESGEAFVSAFFSTLITGAISDGMTQADRRSVIKAYAKDNNISEEQATKLFDGIRDLRTKQVTNANDTFETKSNIQDQISRQLSQEIKNNKDLNLQELQEGLINRDKFIQAVGTGVVSSRGLDLVESYKAYNGDSKYINEIQNIQKFMNNRNIDARFDATMFDNNEQNAIWTTENGQDSVVFNPNASQDQVIQSIATHEMTHDIINQKTEAGTSLFNDVLNEIKNKENYAKDRQEIEDLYAKYYDRNSKDFAAKVDEEMVANELGKNLGTQEYINRLVNEKPNLARRIYNWVVDKLDNIGKSAEYKEQKAYWKSVADKFEKAYNEQKIATGEDKTAYSITKDSNGNDELTLYHGTSLNAAFKIQKYGFVPNSAIGATGGEANYNYFTNSRINAESYRDRKDRYSGQLLRVKKTEDMKIDDRIMGHKKGEYDFRTQRNVTPNEIQILTSDGYWTPISNYDLYTDTPADQKVIDKSLLYDDDGSKIRMGETETKYSLSQNYRGSHQIENAKSITELNLDDVKNKVIEIDGYLTNQAQSDLKKLQKILNNPNDTVKIYRAAPVNELNSGDWVTTDRSYAQNVANNNGGKVYAFEVKASDLYYPDNVRELPSLHRLSSFQYNGENANQTRYSLSTNKDSNGRTLTKEQQEYFKDSKIVDKNGNLLEVYHTTPSKFTIFKKSKTGQNTGYGNTAFGYFVTPNQNFSERFGDINNSNQYIQDLEKVYNNLSKNDLNNLFGMEYKDAVKFKNGVINKLSHKYQKAYYEITNDLVNFEDIQKNQKNYNVMKLYVNATNPITHPYHAGYKYSGVELDNIVENYFNAIGETKGLNALKNEVKNGEYDNLYEAYMNYVATDADSVYENASQERKILESKGYDAVEFVEGLDKDVNYGVSNSNEPVSSYAIFNSNQIKNIDNTTPTSSNDIRYSLTKDNTGRELSKGQKEYFKNSKAVDDDGNLVTVYHTMTNTGNQFNQFNPVGTDYYRFGDQVVNYYTDNQDMSGSYADQSYRKAYTKPINTVEDVQDFIDFQNTQSDSQIGVNGITNHYTIEKNGDGYIVKQNPSGKEYLSYINLSNEGKVALDRVKNNENLHKQFLNNEDSIKILKNQLEEWYNTRQYDGYPELANVIDVYDRESGKLLSQASTYGEQRVIQQMLKMDLEEYLFNTKEFTKEQIDSALEHTLTKTFENEQDLINNIQNDFKAKYQYAGYINMTNPYIIDTFGENWDSVITERNQAKGEEYHRVVKNIETKEKLYQLAQESERLNKEYRHSGKDGELGQMSIIKNKIDNNELRETINDLGMFGFKYEEWLEAGRKNAEMFGGQFETNLPSGNELITNYVSDLNPAEQQIVQGMTINDFVNRYGELSVENQKYGTSSSYFQDQFYKTTGESLNTDIIGYTNMYNMAKYNFESGMVEEILEEKLTTNDLVKRIIEKNNSGETNYDGLIMKNVYDYGGQSNSSYRTTGNIYVTFNSNQFKAVDNLNPTKNDDIRYSMQQQETPVTPGTRTTIGELFDRNIAPIREDLSNITEQMNNLSNQLEAMQESLKNTSESATKGYVEPFREQRYENQSYTPLTEQDAELYQNALMNDEGYLKSIDQEANFEGNNTRLINRLTEDVQTRLGLNKNQKSQLESVIRESIENDYTTDEIANRLSQEFKQQEVRYANEEIKSVKKLIKQTALKVSDGIKADIADYGNFQRGNYNKITFSRNGVPVDVAYQILNDQAPGYFPSDIINPTDQLLKISDVANMLNETVEKYDISDDTFDNIADYIKNSILDEQYNTLMDSQASLDKDIQFNMTEDIAPTTIRSQESIDEMIDNRDIAPVRQDTQKPQSQIRERLETMRRKWGEMVTNRNYEIDKVAQLTGNNEIKFSGDNLNNVSGETQFNINNSQTDVNGKWVGKGLHKLFEGARNEGLADVYNDYLYHKSNVERHNVGKGSEIPLAVSQQLVAKYEQQYPQVKEWARELYKFEDNLLQEQVDSGIISQEKYNDYRGEHGIYRSYVPFYEARESHPNITYDDEGNIKAYSTLKRSKGGATDVSGMLSMEEAIARQVYASKKAIRENELYKEIVSSLDKYDDMMSQDIRDNPTNLEDSLYITPDGEKVLSAYFDGEKVSAKISEELYNELARTNENRIKQIEEDFSLITNPLQWGSKVRRNLLTTWNPTFLVRNAIKDIQDAVINSKYTGDMLANYFGTKKGSKSAIAELSNANTETAQQFLALYGADNLYGDYSNVTDGKVKSQKGINKFARINELIELAPRYAEFKATLQNGGTVNEAIYNAREVTTNFGRGGYITKALNRNGFTFLNANVQGLDKVIRNLSGENGVKGVTSVIAKGAAFAVLPSILNHLLYGSGDDKDEEYDALPDYIKDNYYLVKLMNGKFLRIPKGRINAVFGSLARRTIEAMEGEENAYESWGSNAWSQIGVGDSSGLQTVFTPITQAINNEAWYGGDIVPTRLQNKPAAEQTDASIDALSNFIGKTLNISPYKVNYVIDQYSGGLGDVLLPMMTEETTSGAETPIDYLTAPVKDAFIVNSIDDNKYASEFYNMKDKLQIKSNSQYATDEDKIRYKYMSNMSSRMSDLYAERREVQADTTLSNKEKYAKVQAIQKEINALAKEAMNSYNNFTSTDSYVSVGDVEYYKNDKGEWTKVNDSDSEFTAGMTDSEKTSYYNVKNKIGDIVSTYNNNIKDINDDNLKAQYQSQKRNDITQAIVHSGLDNYSKAMVYSKYYSSADTMKNVANAGYNVDTYITALQDIEELRTKYSQNNGYSTEQRKQKTIAYINSLDMNIPQKAMLIRNYYSSFRSYNTNIVEYVNSLNIPYEDKKAILEGTGMTVNGNKISWK